MQSTDLMVICESGSPKQLTGFGVVEVDEALRVIDCRERPLSPKPMSGPSTMALASMGSHTLDTAAHFNALRADTESVAAWQRLCRGAAAVNAQGDAPA